MDFKVGVPDIFASEASEKIFGFVTYFAIFGGTKLLFVHIMDGTIA
jgi:hypothetical protein